MISQQILPTEQEEVALRPLHARFQLFFDVRSCHGAVYGKVRCGPRFLLITALSLLCAFCSPSRLRGRK